MHQVRGHSEGMVVIRFNENGGGTSAAFCGDLIPTTHHIQPPYIMAYDVDVRFGSPVMEIVAKADEGYDMVVIGSHGHSTLADAVRVMLGDVARNVLRRTNVPVLVVRLPE